MNLNQTLQEKYPHLEVSVLTLNEVQKDNESFRIDSEPFKKSSILTNKNLQQISLANIAKINPPKSEILHLDDNTQITFLAMQDLGNGIINERKNGTIKDFKSGYTYFAENDILIAKITPCMEHGKCAIATNLKNNIGFGSTEFNVFRIIDKRFITEFVFCFLNRNSIRNKAVDNMIGTSGRQRVPTTFYENIPIPIIPMEFQLEIEKMVKDSYQALESSKALYKEAEAMLYNELGLNPNNPLDFLTSKSPNISIRTLEDSFLKTGRLDSEYYQEKYDLIEAVIKMQNYAKLGALVNIKKSIEPGSDSYKEDGIPFVRVGNLNKFEISKSDIFLSTNDFTQNEMETLKAEKDSILFSKDGSIGIAYCMSEKADFITSGAILHLYIQDKSKVLAQYLTLVLNSKLTQLQAERDSGGSIISHWKISEIKEVLIPLLDIKIQENIESKIKQSFELRNKSKALLESAKNKVETMIESAK